MRIKTRIHLPHAFTDYPTSEWEENLFTVFSGGADIARVGRIPPMLAKAIGSSTTIVQLTKYTAKKIRGKHPDITFPELRQLATAFNEENVAREARNHLVFWFESSDAKKRIIKAIIKAANRGTEIYLKTMYPIAKHKVKALKAKSMVLREKNTALREKWNIKQ